MWANLFRTLAINVLYPLAEKGIRTLIAMVEHWYKENERKKKLKESLDKKIKAIKNAKNKANAAKSFNNLP